MGSWPPQEFAFLCERRKQEFYRSLDGMKGKEIVAKAEDFLNKFDEHESMYAENGEYLPLAVWVKRGFDAALIEANSDPKDKAVCRVLGDTYRVPIKSHGTRGREGTIRRSEVGAASEGQPLEQ